MTSNDIVNVLRSYKLGYMIVSHKGVYKWYQKGNPQSETYDTK
jgi:hypothetical protein